MRVALLLDENHSGIISKNEFYRSLIFCEVNGEHHPEVLLNGPPKLDLLKEPSKLVDFYEI